jgi:hypothetical protein
MPLLRTLIIGLPEKEGRPISGRLKEFLFDGETLKDAVSAIERHLKVTVVPHNLHKCFRACYRDEDKSKCVLVGINIKRGDITIYPEQDLNFSLLANDLVSCSTLAG